MCPKPHQCCCAHDRLARSSCFTVMHFCSTEDGMRLQVWRQPKRAGKRLQTWVRALDLPCAYAEECEVVRQAKRRRRPLDPPAINQIAWSTLDTQVEPLGFKPLDVAPGKAGACNTLSIIYRRGVQRVIASLTGRVQPDGAITARLQSILCLAGSS